ncbi:MAG: 50S ribosomal protein L19 [Candidatus Berkelbacteria bacterium]
MDIQSLTKSYQKKNVPDINVGDTVKISFKITEGSKTRIQNFEGLVITTKHGKGLDGSIKVRRVTDGIGIERTFPIHSPLIVKFEKVKSYAPGRAKLYFVRDLVGKKKKKVVETKSGEIWEEPSADEEIARIEAEKAAEAEAKLAEKEKEEQALEEKFEEAVQAHLEEKTEEKAE